MTPKTALSVPSTTPGSNGQTHENSDTVRASLSLLRTESMMTSNQDSLRFISEPARRGELSAALTESFRARAVLDAKSITRARFEKSELENKVKDIPKFDLREVILGKRLGKGGFSNVDEVRRLQIGNQTPPKSGTKRGFPRPLPKKERSDTVAVDDKESRKFIAEHCHRHSGDARYAIKMLRKETLDNAGRITLGLCDLAIETRFLANLSHPHIIKLRAISTADEFAGQYFLILDRLYDTLSQRIVVWKSSHKRLYSFWGKMRDRGGKKRVDFYETRIEKAFDLSAAVEHCHACNIIHRDLKPENIGFDVRGDIKVFDFGMARELYSDDRMEDGNYKLSGQTGSIRFMAPEVWAGRPYNAACDIYSLGIVLWAIIALKKPYAFCEWRNEDHFADAILRPEGKRPDLGAQWPHALQDLLKRSWEHDPQSRLSAKEMTKGLRDELVRLRHGDESNIPDHKRRRSTFIFEQKRDSNGVSSQEMTSIDFLDKSMKSHNS